MAKEGVVVPGKPEKSELVEHLLSIGMQMPPSLPPLPDEQIQLIVTWIAQGARNNQAGRPKVFGGDLPFPPELPHAR